MLKNIITAFFTRSFVALVQLLNLILMSRYLGSAVLGQVSLLVLNIAIIHTIAEIYTGSALVHFIPKLNIKKIYWAGLIWIIDCVLILNFVFFVCEIGLQGYGFHVLIISFISTLHAFHNVLLLGREKISTYNFLIFFQPAALFSVMLVNIFLFEMRTVHSAIYAMYVSYSLSLLISTVAVTVNLKKTETESDFSLKEIFRNGFINQLGNLAHILSNRYNYYVIAALSFAMVGVYSTATSLIESVWIISASVSPLILTHIANRKDIPNHSRLTFLLAKICFLLSLVCVFILFFIPNEFFTGLLGRDFSQAKKIMLYLSPGALCISFSSIISHYFSGLGQQKVLLTANASGLVMTLATSYLFISNFGIVGACYAASLAYFMQALVLTVVFMSQNKIKILNVFTLKEDLRLLK